jgi:hypothetical protein
MEFGAMASGSSTGSGLADSVGLQSWLAAALPAVCDTPQLSTFARRLTGMAEYALASLLLADWEGGMNGWPGETIDRLASAYYSPRVVRSFAVVPEARAAHAWVIEALLARGLDPPVQIAVARAGLRSRADALAIAGHELRHIEARYLMHRLARSTGQLDDQMDDIHLPLAGQSPMTRGSIYDLAHAVFFLTDFGCSAWRAGAAVVAAHHDALAHRLGQAATIPLATSDADLVAEVALAQRCLARAARTPDCTDRLMAALAGWQRPDGAVSGRASARLAQDLYHSTLVTLLAVAAPHP